MMYSVDEQDRLAAIDAARRLRDQFKAVSDFILDPRATIQLAEKKYNHFKRYLPDFIRIPDTLSFSYRPITRHQAKQSLLLNIEPCIALQQELNEVCSTVAEFVPSQDADYEELLRSVIEVGMKVKACVDHIENCIQVLDGRDVILRSLDGPAGTNPLPPSP